MCASTNGSRTKRAGTRSARATRRTAGASDKPARSTVNKATSPEWRMPRDQQMMIEWASQLDRQAVAVTTSLVRSGHVARATRHAPPASATTTIPSTVHPTSGWSFLMHLTFRNPIPNHHAMTAGAHLNFWCSGWRTLQKDCMFRLLLWSAESHILGNVHLHALSVCTPLDFAEHMRLRRSRGRESWSRECGPCSQRAVAEGPDWRRLKESWYVHHGIARVYPFDPRFRFGAERYVVKYILDEKCLDWGVERW